MENVSQWLDEQVASCSFADLLTRKSVSETASEPKKLITASVRWCVRPDKKTWLTPLQKPELRARAVR